VSNVEKNSLPKAEQVPAVDFRFGDQYWVTSFIQLDQPQINVAYQECLHADKDKFVENVAKWINLNFAYPLNTSGDPACEAWLSRFQRKKKKWCFTKFVDYFWNFPVETITMRFGICIETANLCTSLLRKAGVDAFVALGAVYDTASDELIGYHAWTRCKYKGQQYCIETTIHDGTNNLVKASDLYGKKMRVYYVEEAYYDEKGYHGEVEP
jgi:hypothetical protein